MSATQALLLGGAGLCGALTSVLSLHQVTADKGKTNTSLLFELAQQQVTATRVLPGSIVHVACVCGDKATKAPSREELMIELS